MKLIFIISFIVISFSCGRTINEEIIDSSIKTKVIRLVSKPDSIISNVSDIALNVEYIPLQKTSDFRIEVIDKILASENKLFISLVNNIFCFDNEGKYLYKLSGNEKENEETFDVIYDFDISSVDSSLMILSSNKILQYKNTGTEFVFTKSINLGQPTPSKLAIVPETENILLSFIRVIGTEPSLNVLINKQGDTISFKPNYRKDLNVIRSGFSNEIILYKYENNVCFKEKINDTVFSINPASNDFLQRFIFESRPAIGTTSKNINDLENSRSLPSVVNISEVRRFIYFTYEFNNVFHKVFYDKYSDKKFEIDPQKGFLKDNIAGGLDINPVFCSNNKFYSFSSVAALKKYIESEEFAGANPRNPLQKEKLEKLAASLRITDNPVIIVVTLKSR